MCAHGGEGLLAVEGKDRRVAGCAHLGIDDARDLGVIFGNHHRSPRRTGHGRFPRRWCASRRVAFEQELDSQDELAHVHRLGQELVGPEGEPREPVVEIRAGRHEDHRDAGEVGVGLEPFAHRVAVETGHRDVQQDHGGFFFARRRDHQVSRRDRQGLVPCALEAGRDDRALIGFVLGQENLRPANAGHRLRGPHRRAREVGAEGETNGVDRVARTYGVEGTAAGRLDECFQLRCPGADRGKPDGPCEAVQSVSDLHQLTHRPARAEHADLVDEEAHRVALGREGRHEPLPRVVEHLLERVHGRRR